MPAPTTNPKPTPKAPPVCKAGPHRPSPPTLLPTDRIMQGVIAYTEPSTDVAQSINKWFQLRPTGVPGDWQATITQGDLTVVLDLESLGANNTYVVTAEIFRFGLSHRTLQWQPVTPRSIEPLNFADLSWIGPTNDYRATLSILT